MKNKSKKPYFIPYIRRNTTRHKIAIFGQKLSNIWGVFQNYGDIMDSENKTRHGKPDTGGKVDNMSIKELRIKALERFNEKYIHNMEKATNFSNRFYRLCGLSERLFYANNDAEIYNRRKRWIEEEEEKESKLLQRLKNELKQYGLTVYYFGYLPTITELVDGKPNGTEALARWFYNR